MKNCVDCESFAIDEAQEDWSEVTPGNQFHLNCYAGCWIFDPFDINVEQFKAMLSTAETCPHYKLRETK